LVDRVLGEQENIGDSEAAIAARNPATPPMISTSANCCGRRKALKGMR
jgi:hypothetical protein